MLRIFFLLFFLIICQHARLDAQLPVPHRLELPSFDNIPASRLISGGFYPIGFSQSGKFAYAIAPADEACGCYYFEFRIQDLITDKVVYRYDYSGEKASENFKGLEDLWSANSAAFQAALQRNGIQQNLSDFDSTMTSFQVKFSRREFSHPELSRTNFIRSTRVDVKKGTLGKKTVSRLFFGNMYVQDLRALGYFKSPFEDRVALLVARIDRGWEGLPQVLDFQVIGVHLHKGFR